MRSMSIVKDLATCTRNWAEDTRDRVHAPSDLMGMCAIASAHLHRVLKDVGVKTTIAANDGHVFLLLRGCVLDVTATQFDGHDDRPYPRVFYRRHKLIQLENHLRWRSHWDVRYEFSTIEELNRWQRDWSPDQQACGNWDAEFIRDPWKYR